MPSPTPSQTIGPFFGVLVPERGALLMAAPEASGPRVVVTGVVRDGRGAPVPDALVEVWQADAGGRWNHPDDLRAAGLGAAFGGFGRIHTDASGGFTIETIRPGAAPGPDGASQAPHLLIGLFARGLLTRLVTRIYFDDEAANEQDPVLRRVPAARRSTLVAARRGGRYCFDIVLQGPRETVFFDV